MQAFLWNNFIHMYASQNFFQVSIPEKVFISQLMKHFA